MTSKQKRALFKKEFGELLLPQGFSYYDGKFICIHGNEVLLGVDMDLTRSGSVYIQYEVIPFCAGIAFPMRGFSNRIPMHDLTMQEGKLQEINLSGGLKAYYDQMFERDFNVQLHNFTDLIYEKFIKVQSVSESLDFHEWEHLFYGFIPPSNIPELECFQIGKYEKALWYARNLLKHCQDAYQTNLRNFEYQKRTFQGKKQEQYSMEIYQDVVLKRCLDRIHQMEDDEIGRAHV